MKNFIQYIALIALIVGLSNVSVAQEGNFSMYRYTPFYANPGQISTTDQLNFMLNSRIQPLNTGENLTTTIVSGYMPIHFSNNHKLVVGANVSSEQNASLLNSNGGMLAVSYSVPLNDRSELSLGAQGGVFQNKIGGDFITDGQIEGGVLDPGAGQLDPVLNQQHAYPTLSSGIYYRLKDANYQDKAFIGVSLFNMIEPNISFVENGDAAKLPMSIKTIAGYKVYDNATLSVSPTVRWINQAQNNAFDLGTDVGYRLSGDAEDFKKLILSLWYNSNSIGVMSLAYEQKRIAVGVSYDIPVGTGFNMAQNGIFEFAISYKLKNSKQAEETPRAILKEESVQQEEVENEIEQPQRKEVEEVVEIEEAEEPQIEEPVKEKPEIKEPVKKEQKVKEKAAEVTVQPLTEKEKETLAKTVRFKLNSDDLNEDSKAFIDQVIDILSKKENYNITLIGHTCNLGESSFNGELGMDRAEIVRDYMVANGINKTRISTNSKGETDPIATNENKLGREKNRRVEFEVTYQ
ncbi:PorP/SprF family type IX secretion system membrane protein [Marivirga tractuosa]|uniref:PorP/SprF family type IX secretion system membrane protein n=1 Tax=Marivirga tractuosa TaxID=1006 RepID=UPI0035CED0D1